MSEKPAEGPYPIIVMTVSWNRNETNPEKAIFLNVLAPDGVSAHEVYTALNLAQQRLVRGMSNATEKLLQQLVELQEETLG